VTVLYFQSKKCRIKEGIYKNFHGKAKIMVEIYSSEILNRPDLFYQLINNMTDLVFLTKVNRDKSLSYVVLNTPAKDLYGLTNESFGRPIEDVLPKNAYHIVKSKYEEAMEKKSQSNTKIWLLFRTFLKTVQMK
jgi:hypothetical protein